MNYRRLPAVSLAGRMFLVALIIGTAVTAPATGRITILLVLSGTAGWLFVPALQLLTGLLIIRGVRHGRLQLLDRYFALGWPWLLWILAANAAFLLSSVARELGLWVLGTAVVPMFLTARELHRFCTADLGMDRREAFQRTAIHQVVTYALVAAYIAWAVALWPRIVGLLA